MKKLLIIVFHFPPLHGSSGIHRTLSFSRYLSEYGWQPLILTVIPGAYPETRNEQNFRIPENVLVKRAFAMDAARQLSVGGFFPRLVALPDRWVSWWPGGTIAGLGMIRKHKPDAIFSTYPIATAHLIGLSLHRLTGLPWISDFRDPMTEVDPITGEEYPLDSAIRRVNRWIEKPTIRHSSKVIFTAPGSAAMYAKRYPEVAPSRWVVIPNGYDEETFAAAERNFTKRKTRKCSQAVLVHSGILYPLARNPFHFFRALAGLRRIGRISASNLRIVLRDCGDEKQYRRHIQEMEIDDIVFLEPSVAYQAALEEMLMADGLLVFQASNCNWQIPAKLYECLRAKRPIFAMTDKNGDTAGVLKAIGVGTIVPLDSEEKIAEGLTEFLCQIREGRAPTADDEALENHSRKNHTRRLAALLESLISHA